MNIKKATEALNHISTLFELYNINYWLEFGTLVGAIRQKEIIPWDNDVDLSVEYDMKKIYNLKSSTHFNSFEIYYKNHYSIRDKETKEHLICLLPYVQKNNKIYRVKYLPPITYFISALEGKWLDYLPMDYYTVQLIKIKILNKLYRKWIDCLFMIAKKLKKRRKLIDLLFGLQKSLRLYTKEYKCTSDVVFPLKKSVLSNEYYNVPAKSEEYLTAIYGNWRIPIHKGKIMKSWKGKKLELNERNEMIIG